MILPDGTEIPAAPVDPAARREWKIRYHAQLYRASPETIQKFMKNRRDVEFFTRRSAQQSRRQWVSWVIQLLIAAATLILLLILAGVGIGHIIQYLRY